MQKFERDLQIVRDAPRFFALLFLEQRPVTIDCAVTLFAPPNAGKSVRLRCDRVESSPPS